MIIEKWGLALLVSAVAVLAPVQPLIMGVGFLIMADLATGLIAARKRGDKITSRAMSRSVWKMAAYQVCILSAFAVEHLILDVMPVAKLAASVIGLVEFRSVAENVKTITGVDLRAITERVTGKGRE
jgi:Bacteriophage holin family